MSLVSKIEVFASCELKPDFVSKRIMRFLFGRRRADSLVDVWSHVGMIVTTADGRETVYDATGKGIDKSDLSELLKEHTLPRRIDITERIQGVSLDFLHGWLEGRRGVEYSSSQYLLFALPAWCRRLTKLFSNGSEKAICSEFVYNFCCISNVLSSGLFENPDAVDPKMAIEAIEAVMREPILPRGK